MARNESEAVVTLPLLDRLIDREPQNRNEALPTRAQSVRQLKAALRRDLEWLLNTRRINEAAGEEFPELSRSLYNYGLPEITSLGFSNPKDRQRLLRSLEATIRLFEPRLSGVKVAMLDPGASGANRILRFQIEALLEMDPAPEQVTFDTVLQLTSGEYEVRGEKTS